MTTTPSLNKKSNRRLAVVSAFFILLFIVAFWNEISLIFIYYRTLLQAFIAAQNAPQWTNADVRLYVSQQKVLLLTVETQQAFRVLQRNFMFGFLVYAVMLVGISQFVLPVYKIEERLGAFKRLILYMFRFHGPAIFVKEGKIVSDMKELKLKLPGVALLDLSSAIVLEKSLSEKGRLSSPFAEDDAKEPAKNRISFFGRKKKNSSQVEISAFGPGIVFTKWGQKVHGSVDLRKQVRAVPNVDAYTRDGIRVESSVFTVFSLSEEPETIYVAYIGDKTAENLRAIILDKNVENPSIEEVSDLFKLNEVDANEVHSKFTNGDIPPHTQSVEKEQRASHHPFPFHKDRVIQALYYMPHTVGEQNTLEWSALPNMVTVEAYRNTIAQYSYDYMHKPDSPHEFPLANIKKEFTFRVKSRGLMKYQLVSRRDGSSFSIHDPWDKNAMLFSQPLPFEGRQALRDRGIKVIAAGFGELNPPAEIREGLLDNWRAHWEKEIHAKLAQRDLESARIRNHARIQAQEESSFVLSDVFKGADFSEEALTVRVFQALEAASTDVSESRLLPHDTINMLWSLYQWMLRDDEKSQDNESSSPDEDMPGGGE